MIRKHLFIFHLSVSNFLNILISIYYFKDIGFIIIPIATSISSWFNAISLFIFLKIKIYFLLIKYLLLNFFKILFASILMGILFKYLIINF